MYVSGSFAVQASERWLVQSDGKQLHKRAPLQNTNASVHSFRLTKSVEALYQRRYVNVHAMRNVGLIRGWA